jgi:hypothetical protein
MKMRNVLLTLSALLILAGFAPRAQAQAANETLTIIDSSCTTAQPCALELYRAALATGTTSCPAPGSSAYTALTSTQVVATGMVNTAWTYADSTILAGTTYCYYATVTLASGGAASRPSAFFEASIPSPAAPTISGSYEASSPLASAPATTRAGVTGSSAPVQAPAPKAPSLPTVSGTYNPAKP